MGTRRHTSSGTAELVNRTKVDEKQFGVHVQPVATQKVDIKYCRRVHFLLSRSVYCTHATSMPPVAKKVGDANESYSRVDEVQNVPDQPRYRNDENVC